MKNIKTLILVIISIVYTGLLWGQELSDREKQNQINYLFKIGTECYYQGKYSQAVKYWEAVLDIDPQQTQPPALIENAREQIEKESVPVYEQLKAAIEKGGYIEAQEHNLKLLDLDSSNKEYKQVMKKLKKIVNIFSSVSKNKRVARLVRQSVQAYVLEPVDIDFSFSSVRLARQLDKNNEQIKKFYKMLKAEYPPYAKKHAEIEGVNVLDRILQNSLNYIYQGQYVEAITECNRALKLDPGNLLAMKRLGSAYFALGNKKQAYKIWGKALKLNPSDKELKKFLKTK